MVTIAHDYRADYLPEIVKYCQRDVESVRQAYKRLIFLTPVAQPRIFIDDTGRGDFIM